MTTIPTPRQQYLKIENAIAERIYDQYRQDQLDLFSFETASWDMLLEAHRESWRKIVRLTIVQVKMRGDSLVELRET